MHALAVTPTHDEVATLERVVTGARAAGAEVLIVDDASRDGTAALADRLAAADERVAVLHRPSKQGLGSAYRDGFRWGLARGFEVLCEIDADLSHDPADLARLLDALDTGADMAIGSRYVPGGRVVDWDERRLRLSRGGNAYVRVVTGLPVRDATSGYRAYRRKVLETIDLSTVVSDGYAFQVEMALRAWRSGFTIREVPIVFTERREGVSKMSRAIVGEALWRVLQWGLSGPRHPPR